MSNVVSKLRKASADNTAPNQNLPSDVIDFAKRGRRLSAEEIAREFYGGHVEAEWVHDNVAYRCRVSYRVVLWWEYDVRVHLEDERTRALAGDAAWPRKRKPRQVA